MDDVDQYGLKTVNLLTARKRGTLNESAAALWDCLDLERMAELLVVSWQAQDQRIQELEAQLGTGGS